MEETVGKFDAKYLSRIPKVRPSEIGGFKHEKEVLVE